MLPIYSEQVDRFTRKMQRSSRKIISSLHVCTSTPKMPASGETVSLKDAQPYTVKSTGFEAWICCLLSHETVVVLRTELIHEEALRLVAGTQ